MNNKIILIISLLSMGFLVPNLNASVYSEDNSTDVSSVPEAYQILADAIRFELTQENPGLSREQIEHMMVENGLFSGIGDIVGGITGLFGSGVKWIKEGANYIIKFAVAGKNFALRLAEEAANQVKKFIAAIGEKRFLAFSDALLKAGAELSAQLVTNAAKDLIIAVSGGDPVSAEQARLFARGFVKPLARHYIINRSAQAQKILENAVATLIKESRDEQ